MPEIIRSIWFVMRTTVHMAVSESLWGLRWFKSSGSHISVMHGPLV